MKNPIKAAARAGATASTGKAWSELEESERTAYCQHSAQMQGDPAYAVDGDAVFTVVAHAVYGREYAAPKKPSRSRRRDAVNPPSD